MEKPSQHLSPEGLFRTDLPGIELPDGWVPVKITKLTAPHLWKMSYAFDHDKPIFAQDLRAAIRLAGFAPGNG